MANICGEKATEKGLNKQRNAVKGIAMQYETYRVYPDKRHGTFAVTDCGRHIYHVSKDDMIFHGKLCPACNWLKNEKVTLLLRGTPEAEKYCKRCEDG